MFSASINPTRCDLVENDIMNVNVKSASGVKILCLISQLLVCTIEILYKEEMITDHIVILYHCSIHFMICDKACD